MASDKENTPEVSQSEKQPTSRFSEQQGTESSGQAPDTFEAFVEKFPDFEDYLEKKVQSKQDRRLGKVDQYDDRLQSLEDEQTSIRQTLSEFNKLKDEGLTDEQAVREMERDQEIRQLKEAQESKSTPSAGTEEQTWAERERAILEDYGLERNDPAFIEFVRENLDTPPSEYIKKLDVFGLKRRNSNLAKPQPSAGTAAQTAGASGTSPDLEASYKKEMEELRQTNPGDARAVFNLKKKYRDLGYDVS